MEERGRVAVVGTMRAMARAGDNNATLVELKAVDASYPLAGEIKLDPPEGLVTSLAAPVGVYGAAAGSRALFAANGIRGRRKRTSKIATPPSKSPRRSCRSPTSSRKESASVRG